MLLLWIFLYISTLSWKGKQFLIMHFSLSLDHSHQPMKATNLMKTTFKIIVLPHQPFQRMMVKESNNEIEFFFKIFCKLITNFQILNPYFISTKFFCKLTTNFLQKWWKSSYEHLKKNKNIMIKYMNWKRWADKY